MREWLRETHGPGFELLRHFLLRFFDSDMITAPGETGKALAGAFSLLLPWFPLLAQPLRAKYAHFSKLAVAEPYRLAVRADELWLLTLMMSAIGLLTAIKWQSLFPSLGDYRALGWLPLRAGQIFSAKLAALLVVATAAVVTLNCFPSVIFPVVSASRWQINPSLGAHIVAHALASAAACYFFFFALVALQGVLLNLFPPRAFGRVSGCVQGLSVALMLVLIVLSFSIGPRAAEAASRPEYSRWLPPVWFMGLYQAMLGDADPGMQALAHEARVGLLAAAGLALLSYAVSYRRHRQLLVEGMAGASKDRRWTGAVLDRLIPAPRQQAVIVFMMKTLARSSNHRMVVMGYSGFAAAVVMTGLLGMRDAFHSASGAAGAFVFVHMIGLAALLLGSYHLFSIPAELRANWAFQITESECRAEWLDAVDRFVLVSGAVLMLVMPFPIELKLLGWRAFLEAALFVALGLVCYERVFESWLKLPFTCSRLPGKTPMWIIGLALLAALALLPVIYAILLMAVNNTTAFVVILAILAGAWKRLHAAREEGRHDLRLKYEEAPDPAVHGLNLGS